MRRTLQPSLRNSAIVVQHVGPAHSPRRVRVVARLHKWGMRTLPTLACRTGCTYLRPYRSHVQGGHPAGSYRVGYSHTPIYRMPVWP